MSKKKEPVQISRFIRWKLPWPQFVKVQEIKDTLKLWSTLRKKSLWRRKKEEIIKEETVEQKLFPWTKKLAKGINIDLNDRIAL
jgi:hypothetical protein